jgi:DNA-binding transcriptional LysR family regulator
MEDLDVETLFEDKLIIAVGKAGHLSRRRTVDLADLLDEPWILANPPSWNHSVIAEACRSRGLKMPNIVLSTFSTHIRASMVSAGKFVSTFPRSNALFYAKRFDLKLLQVELPQKPWPVAILTVKGRTLAPVTNRFLDHVREQTAKRYVISQRS